MKAYRARRIISMSGCRAAQGEELFAPLKAIDNGIIVAAGGRIAGIGPRRSISLPPGCTVADLGDVTLIPAPVNAHCHLGLSHLAGKTVWGKGFVPWLESLVPLLQAERKNPAPASESACLAACQNAREGAAVVGDIASPAPESLSLVEKCARNTGLGIYHFYENFGFDLARLALPGKDACPGINHSMCAAAGHALYSTSPAILRLARQYCRERSLVFSLHLAESPEETAQLLDNTGPLLEFYRKYQVLPKDWRAPRLRPLAFAKSLGLLGPGFLAVHGVWLDEREMRELARSQSALCLCPRSNANLAAGNADLARLIASRVLLALGTDGLVSNADVNVINEALFLRAVLPDEALIRMLTVNGARALNLSCGRLEKGLPAEFRIWPD